MSRPSKKKVLQYLKEARASELALVRVLQSQIAMTPSGTFRTVLERHLFETREHARLLQARVREVEGGFHPVAAAIGLAEGVVGQALALSKTPLDLVRGTGGEEKVLKNAKDAAATESLEIATYTALEQLARRAGDEDTARLAVRIRRDEERMLDKILSEIPGLTDAVYSADVGGDPSYDATKTGAADAARTAVAGAKGAAAKVADGAKGAKAGVEDVAGQAAVAAQDAAAGAKDVVEQAAEDAKDTAKDATDDARATAQDAKAKAQDVADDAKATAKDAGDAAKAKAQDAKDDAQDAANAAKAKAQDVADDAKATAKDAGDAAKAKAQDAKDDAKDAAGAAKAKAQDVADDARATAKDAGDAAKSTAQDVAAEAEGTADDAASGGTDTDGADLEKPWPAYDELSVEEVLAVLLTADPETAQSVVEYETANQGRDEVLNAAGRKVPAA
ncbi:unannotated protein [freshwater metagenome]|uniref:Unannotated protein n=1 Tax=freshwater metagenome TaxID=449393 RepID=A0A6J7K588_9ZZZZ